MKNLIAFSLSIVLLSSCSESKDEMMQEGAISNHTEVTADTVIQEIIEDTIKDIPTNFEYFDDYTSILTKEDLLAHFDKTNLTNQSVWYAEGTMEKKSTLLIDPNTKFAILYVWSDENPDKVDFIEANFYLGDSTTQNNKGLTTKDGLKIGMTINELADWNGNTLSFLGFGWDYSGGVMVDSTDRFSTSNYQVNLGFDEFTDEFMDLLGDVTLNTDMDIVKKANIYVNQITFYPPKVDE